MLRADDGHPYAFAFADVTNAGLCYRGVYLTPHRILLDSSLLGILTITAFYIPPSSRAARYLDPKRTISELPVIASAPQMLVVWRYEIWPDQPAIGTTL